MTLNVRNLIFKTPRQTKAPKTVNQKGLLSNNEVIMETNSLSVKSKSGLVFPALVALIIANVIFFTAIKSADRQERNAPAVKAQVQSEREAQSLYEAAKKGDR